MKFSFHKAVPRSREVGIGSSRESCSTGQLSRRFCQSLSGPLNPGLVTAHLELGAHDAVFIRGHGAGLSWDLGQRLTCVDSKTWVWLARGSNEKIEFQFLLNDEVWEKGAAHVLEPGKSLELAPDFEWPDIPRITSPQTHEHLS